MVRRLVVVLVSLAALAGCADDGPSSPDTTSSVTLSPVTTSAITLSPVTTSAITLSPVTTSPIGRSSSAELFPDVLEVELTPSGDGTWRVSATLSSPYDTPDRYADAWRVLGPDGTVLGVRELAHDHAAEQPFTRSLGGVVIPDDVRTVTVQGRDQLSGWGGAVVSVAVPAAAGG